MTKEELKQQQQKKNRFPIFRFFSQMQTIIVMEDPLETFMLPKFFTWEEANTWDCSKS